MKTFCLKNSTGINFTKKSQIQRNNFTATKPNLLEKTPEKDQLELSPKKKISKKNKFLIALGAIGAGTIAAIAILKGKKAKILSSIPDDLKPIFAKIKNKKGDEFVSEAYSEMVKYLGLEGIAPSKISKTGADGIMTITGGFSPTNKTIGYSDGFFSKLNRTQQLNMLSHELRHCRQTVDFLRTEGIGIEEYAKAWTESSLKAGLDNPFNAMIYKQAQKSGAGEEFLANSRKSIFEKIKKSLEENYADVLKMPKISADSEEGRRIHKLFAGCREYEGIGMFGLEGENYRSNPLEIDAYEFGEQIQKLFSDFIFASYF